MEKAEIKEFAKEVVRLQNENKADEMEKTHCKIGWTVEDVEALKELTGYIRSSKKAVRRAIFRIIVISLIGGFLFFLSEKAKSIILVLAKLFN